MIVIDIEDNILQDCHVRDPPHERVEDEHICIAPAAAVLRDGLDPHRTLSFRVVLHYMVGVRLHQVRGPVEFKRGVVFLRVI